MLRLEAEGKEREAAVQRSQQLKLHGHARLGLHPNVSREAPALSGPGGSFCAAAEAKEPEAAVQRSQKMRVQGHLYRLGPSKQMLR